MDGCWVIIDDYAGPGSNIKVPATKAGVDGLVATGSLEPLGLYGWSTWSGGGEKAINMASGVDITVWIISALLAIGVGWSRYAKWKTREKLVRELAAMDPERREKVLSRLNPSWP